MVQQKHIFILANRY